MEDISHRPKTVQRFSVEKGVNDPSAGSPTETLLRLFLPLNVKAYTTSSVGQEKLPNQDHDSGVFALTFNR